MLIPIFLVRIKSVKFSNENFGSKIDISGVGIVDGIDASGKLKVKWSCGLESAVKPNNVISESILFGDAFDDMNFGSNDDDGFGLPSDDEENIDGGEDGDSDDWVSCDSSSSGIDVKGNIGDIVIFCRPSPTWI